MTSITTRAGKGTPLTHTEVDDNFTNLNADKLEASNNLSDVSSASAARTNLGLGTAATTASTDYATAAQGSLADSAVQPDDDVSLGTVTADGLTVGLADGEGVFVEGGTGTFSEASYYFAQGGRASFGYNGSRVSISDYGNSGVTANKSLSIALGGAERLFINHQTGDISFYEDTGTTPKFFWDAGAESLGIGTSSPQEKLHVIGSAKLDFGSGGGNPRLYFDHDTVTDDANYIQLNRGDAGLEIISEDNLKFNTNGSEAMRITSAGNVGIGTGSPDALLHVADSGAASDDFTALITAFRPNLTFGDNSSSSTDWQVFVDSNDMQFRYGDSDTGTKLANEAMRIDSSGQVGIGTSSPSHLLDVEGSGDVAMRIGSTGTGDADATFYVDAGDTGESAVYFQTDGVNQAYISMTGGSGGDINIGTVADAGRNIDFQPNNSLAMRIDPSGNVLVGTSSGSDKLTVNGTVNATTFVGDGSSLSGIAAGASGGGSDEIFWENGQNVTTNYTITNGKNAMSAGPITIDSGVTVTVGAGETWTVV